jgi:hypothetical protein
MATKIFWSPLELFCRLQIFLVAADIAAGAPAGAPELQGGLGAGPGNVSQIEAKAA